MLNNIIIGMCGVNFTLFGCEEKILYNSQDERLGQSTWRWSYDYEVDGERDISDLDDKNFVRLRRKRNKIITLMYSVVLIMFILSMSLLSQILIFFLN